MKELELYIQRYHHASDLLRRKVLSEIDYLIDHLQLGLTRSQYHMLHAVQEIEPCNISTLAKKMDVKPSAITVMIDRLVRANLVARYHDEKDRRVVLVKLTKLGLDSIQKVDKFRQESMTKILNRLDSNELKAYVETYEKIAQMYSSDHHS